ncbi:MAG TPA: amidohydrolase family protein [Phycisphaerae bacterium]|nr:amidohydrolase family protein [Phycisphaerae bacterium]
MGAIDVHVHAFPDEIAARAMERLRSEGDIPSYGDGTVGGLLASMDSAGIDAAFVCAIATKPSQAEGLLKWCEKIRSERIEPLASVHPADPEAPRWIRRIAEAGLAGIKLHPMYQEFAVDEERVDPLYAAAGEQEILVACHCGLDLAYPPDDDRASPPRYARVLDKFPDLRLLCTHMGGWRSWELVEEHLLGRPVFLETSFSLKELGPQRSVDMIRRHGVERVLFGSDWPWSGQAEAVRIVQAVGLTSQEQRAIFHANAALLRVPRPKGRPDDPGGSCTPPREQGLSGRPGGRNGSPRAVGH